MGCYSSIILICVCISLKDFITDLPTKDILFFKKIFACCIKMQICCHTSGRVLIKFRDRQDCFTERQCFWLCTQHSFYPSPPAEIPACGWLDLLLLGLRRGCTLCCSRAKLLISRWPESKRGEKGYGDKMCSSKKDPKSAVSFPSAYLH